MNGQKKSTEEKLLIVLVAILIVLVLVLLGGGAYVYLQFQNSGTIPGVSQTPQVQIPAAQEPTNAQEFPMAEMSVYFVSPVDFKLVAETRLALELPDLVDRVRKAMELLLEGPTSEDLVSVAPAQSALLAVFYNSEEKRVYLDINASFYRNLPDHTLAEWAAIYSVVNTVCGVSENIESVVFLEEGVPVRQSPGNWDWNRPFTPEVAWVRYITDADAYSEE